MYKAIVNITDAIEVCQNNPMRIKFTHFRIKYQTDVKILM